MKERKFTVMSKIPLTITMNIDDASEIDLAQKLDILRKNERLSEFCSQAIKRALDDSDACNAMNKKIEINGYGILLDRQAFYEQVNKKLAYLETQLNALRYDMHTAAVLADKAFYKEITVDVLSTLDALFQSIKNNVQLYPGDYIDTMRWKQRETELQNQFAGSLNNMRMIQAALNFDDEPQTVQPVKAEIHSEQLEEQRQSLLEQHEQLTEQSKQILDMAEKITELVNGISDIKEVLLSSDIILQQTKTTSTQSNQTPTSTLPAYVPTPVTQQTPVQYEEASEEFTGDLSALTDFFGGM